MNELGRRPIAQFPSRYGDFRVFLIDGMFYAIPSFLDVEETLCNGAVYVHPAIVSAPTLEEIEERIDRYDATPYRQGHLGRHNGHNLYRLQGAIYAVPEFLGAVDLNLAATRNRIGILSGDTLEEVRAAVDRLSESKSIEFAGWLPVFAKWGNCGTHPQFSHAAIAPEGYRFTCSARPKRFAPTRLMRLCKHVGKWLARFFRKLWILFWPIFGVLLVRPTSSVRGRLRVMGALFRQFFLLLGTGAKLRHVVNFLRARQWRSQLLLAERRDLVFLTSMPYTFSQNPWIIEIEVTITLLYPHVQNGFTCNLDVAASPYVPIVRKVLESDQCRGIITHVQSTARMLPNLFRSERINRKIFHVPLGVKLPERPQRHEESETVNLLFINSWSQTPTNFYLRGGLDILTAFDVLHERYPQLRLTMRTKVPQLDEHYFRIMERGWVRLIQRFVQREEMEALLAESHVFLLPAARIHIVSLLQAMASGLAVVGSDGWGMEEYLTHEHNGLIVKGRYGKVSWADEEAGILREDYTTMRAVDPVVVEELIESVSRLVEDRGLRKRLGRNARRDVETKYSHDHWNRGLKEVLDKITTNGVAGRPGELPVVSSEALIREVERAARAG